MEQEAHQGAWIWTTSRYASLETKKRAQTLAGGAGSCYIARGKKTIDDIAEFARRLGFVRIMLLEECAGHPSQIRTIDISPDGRWKWADTMKIEEYTDWRKAEKYES